MTLSQVEPAGAVAPGATLAAVRAMRPLIAANRHAAHTNGRMAPSVLEACRNAGVFTMVSPREVGGADADLPEVLAVFEELGYSDPTIAWHAGNSFALAGYAAFLGQAERDAIFTGERGPFGYSAIFGGVAQPAAGGYRLTGRWQFVTGCLDAPWAFLSGTVHESGCPRLVGESPDIRAFIVPASDFAIERTWDAATAMRGTGSHAVSVSDVFVPEGLALSLLEMPPRHLESKSSRWPRGASSPVTNAAIAVGIARRAVDDAIELIKSQSPRADYAPYRARKDVQQAVAAGMAAVNAYSAGVQAMGEELQAAVNRRERVSLEMRARMWGSLHWTIDQSRTLVSEMARISTSALYSRENASELGVRDLHAIAASMEAVRDAQEAAGRVYLGMPPDRVPF